MSTRFWANKEVRQLFYQSMMASSLYSRNAQSFALTHQLCETLQRPRSIAIEKTMLCHTLKKGKTWMLPFSLYKILFPSKNKICGHSLTLRAYAKSLSILMSILTACYKEIWRLSRSVLHKRNQSEEIQDPSKQAPVLVAKEIYIWPFTIKQRVRFYTFDPSTEDSKSIPFDCNFTQSQNISRYKVTNEYM